MKRLRLLESEEHRQSFLIASAEKMASAPAYLHIYLVRGSSASPFTWLIPSKPFCRYPRDCFSAKTRSNPNIHLTESGKLLGICLRVLHFCSLLSHADLSFEDFAASTVLFIMNLIQL